MQIHDLTRQNPATGSQLVFDTGSATYKALVSDVAKVIMEQYSGTTLAGSAQTPKAAIDTLNSNLTRNTGFPLENTADLNSFYASMVNGNFSFARYTQTSSNIPRTGGSGVVMTFRNSPNYGGQVAFDDVATYYRPVASGSFGAWTMLPTRAEMDKTYLNTIEATTFADAYDSATASRLCAYHVGAAPDDRPAGASENNWYGFLFKNPTGKYGWQIAFSFSNNAFFRRQWINSSTPSEWYKYVGATTS